MLGAESFVGLRSGAREVRNLGEESMQRGAGWGCPPTAIHTEQDELLHFSGCRRGDDHGGSSLGIFAVVRDDAVTGRPDFAAGPRMQGMPVAWRSRIGEAQAHRDEWPSVRP